MGDMIERAAIAFASAPGSRISWTGTPKAWSELDESQKEEMRVVLRPALLAALDPEDEALRTAVGAAIAEEVCAGEPWDEEEADALGRAAVIALRTMAQGEPR